MSYKCDVCGLPFYGKPTLVVQEIRKIMYPPKEEYILDPGDKRQRLVVVTSRIGTEYAKVVQCCPFCAADQGPPKVVETIERELDDKPKKSKAGSKKLPAYLLYSVIAFSSPSSKTISRA